MFERNLDELNMEFLLKLFGTLDVNTDKLESAFGVWR